MKKILAIFILGLGVGACASLVIPALENRELRIHESGQLYYQYCKNYGFLSGKCKEWAADYYDLKKKEVRDQLSNFTCKNKNRKF